MILKQIEQLESQIRNSTGLSAEQQSQLLALLETMKVEAASVPASADRLSPAPIDGDERPAEVVVEDIRKSVEQFEASHPRLTELTNQIAVVLSNMGI